ncbi:MAG TPA: putative toxin-antitoxin system toxin component, PIN family [Terriglobales bacterium]|nr:putative toxin-antitoxin system toxin component, PIN family [Terriglobales bacterium]
MIKAVIDTNVLVSGIFWTGTPARILQAWSEGRFRLLLSIPILEEYARVIEEVGRRRLAIFDTRMLYLLTVRSEVVDPPRLPQRVCTDPDDDKFLETAVGGDADYVISGDRALLRLQTFQGGRILKPAEFLHILTGS